MKRAGPYMKTSCGYLEGAGVKAEALSLAKRQLRRQGYYSPFYRGAVYFGGREVKLCFNAILCRAMRE